MRVRHSPATIIWLPLILLFSVWSVHAKDDVPRLHSQRFDTRPVSVQYFEDSDVVLAIEERGVLWRSTDAGVEWSKIKDIPQDDDGFGSVESFWMHPFDKDKAYALSPSNKHWFTKDKGESWESFTASESGTRPSLRAPLAFHAGNSKKVIFNTAVCRSPFQCDEEGSYYTTNDFKKAKELRSDSRGCIWAHSSPQSHSDRMKEDKDDDRVICVSKGIDSDAVWNNRLLMSDDFFETSSEPHMNEGRPVKGIINVTNVKGYIITAAKATGSTELSLFVTVDGEHWHRAEFPVGHKVRQDEYTVVESTNYSLQVDVMNTNVFAPMGVLFSSNSNGTYFTENIRHTNRNLERIVDFEKIQGIQGIIMVNVVKNWEAVENDFTVKKNVQSKISFDDGRTFEPLRVNSGKGGKKDLHLHSVTDISNVGRVFSSPAPGLVMGIGNTGDQLGIYEEGDLFVSDDAGLTWFPALAESHKYEFGDQGTVLLAITDRVPATKLSYSLNHGDDWKTAEIDKGDQVSVAYLTTVPDSTSLKFILQATKREKDGNLGFYIYSIDFNGIYDDKCKDDDFEEWYARLDQGEPDCLMGHKQKYRRRKKGAKCYVGEKFKEAEPEFEKCKCTVEDYECDFNFKPEWENEKKKCVPATKLAIPEGACAGGDETFKGTAGFRKIPGNQCYDGEALDEAKVDRPCKQSGQGPRPDGELDIEITDFTGDGFGQKVYLERSDAASGSDETLIMSVTRGGSISGIFKTNDHGKTWERILEDQDNIQAIVQHPYENDRAFFLAPNSKEVWYTINRADTMHKFTAKAPLSPDWNAGPISFHPTKEEYILWLGTEDCGLLDEDCHNVAYLSKDRGDSWLTVARYSKKCEFIKPDGRANKEDLLFCVQHKDEKPEGALELRSSEDFFNNYETEAEDVLTFATMSEFIIVAQKDVQSNLRVKASVWGGNFAEALFPADFNVISPSAYTLLDSSTHAVFMHVTVGSMQGFEYGRIMKSNSNGTSYVLSVDNVNRDFDGWVDFEKMLGIDGVAMVNVVGNVEEEASGKSKRLRSLITHNDGSEWAPLKAPDTKPGGESWDCDVSKPEECSLHLHSYTERDDPRNTFSSPSAIGLMMGVGNVGKYLGYINDPDDTYTFLSTDAGINWKAVKKGRFKWEYGDQGSVIVIVERAETDKGYYTTDQGDSWKEFKLGDKPAQVLDLSTLPSDNSKQFLVWVKYGTGKVATINVDFSPIRSDTICKVPEENDKENDDYYLWAPQHPLQENDCVFGRKIKYLRKRVQRDCWNGPKLDRQHGEITNCTCTKRDFEW